MEPFPVSNGYSYIFLAIDYVSRWVEATTTKTNNAKVVVDFLKSNIFCRFGVPKALISDKRSHFCNQVMSSLLEKMGWCIEFPQPTILRKTAKLSQKDWSRLLEDALWAYETAYQTPLGNSPYWIVFDKAYHLPIEIEHRAY
ncbi:gag-pol, partial [Mucuna pruriens]